MHPFDRPVTAPPPPATELFRQRFARALRHCVRRRFSVAECFGVIWLETLEEVPLTDQEQMRLSEELRRWAREELQVEAPACTVMCFSDQQSSGAAASMSLPGSVAA